MTREIVLVCMPFAARRRPSFALSQLSALVERDFAGDYEVRACYPSHDFARFFGAADYDVLANDMAFHVAGVGDWLFRQIAFPDVPDNQEEYFTRYFTGPDQAVLRRRLLDRRASLRDVLDALIDKYRLDEADIVGFSSMFLQTVPSLAMARLIKDRNPQVLTLMGGANCEAPMGAALVEHTPQLDFVFSGPALKTFPRFLRSIADGDAEVLDKVPGIVSARNCRDPRYRRAIGGGSDIDDYFDPDYRDFKASFDQMNAAMPDDAVTPALFFETSRGCWWGERAHCTFCGLNGQTMAYRSMSPENAQRQFDWLFSHSGWASEYCCTDNIMPMEYLEEVFPKVTPPPGASIFYEVKVGLDQQDMEVMGRAGVTAVQPGIEALSTATLKLMRKGTSSFQNLQFLENCVRHGINPVWNLLIGFPGEEESTYRKYAAVLPKLFHLPPPEGCFFVRFDRYSPYFNEAEAYGLELAPVAHYRLTYPFPKETLDDLAYYFADQRLAPYMVAAANWTRPLGRIIDAWRTHWEERRPVLRLDRECDRWVITDTRVDEPRRYELGADEAELLLFLDKPIRLDNLAGSFPAYRESTLAVLEENGLVFRDGNRIMSLVFADTADPMPRPRRSTVVGARKRLDLLAGA